MRISKKLFITLVIIICVALIAGITILAATNLGSQSDPLVTLSYLNDTAKQDFLASANERINTKVSAFESSLDSKIAGFEADIKAQLSSGGVSSDTDVFSVVTLGDGQTVVCSVGAEIMLRIGSAAAYGSDSPALIDTTTASSVEAGSALVKNHMYMVTINGCGVTATSATTKILIRGDYSIA